MQCPHTLEAQLLGHSDRKRRYRPGFLLALFHQLLAHPVDHGWAGIQGLDDPAITPTLTGSETSAFNNIRAFSSRRAGLFPFRTSVSSCWRSSLLSLTTYVFTEISFAAILASIANPSDGSESTKSFQSVLPRVEPPAIKARRRGRRPNA